MKDLRRVQILSGGEWFHFNFRDLKPGIIFKLFDSNDEPVISEDGATEFLATGEVFLDEKSVANIECICINGD